MKDLVGNKGAQLGEMSSIGIPVPPGFVITTRACVNYLKSKKIPDSLKKEILSALKELEKKTKRKFGSMMDTILNLGLNDETVKGLAKQTKNEWFAYDTYRRFIQMFGSIVLGIGEKKFDSVLEKRKKEEKAKTDQEISVEGLKKVVKDYKKIASIPDDPQKQLFMAVEAVFKSWNNKRARNYRKYQGLPDDVGTAVVVQTMVFGNLDDKSGTGVAFTRNPATGKKELYGEFLLNAQGEDIVSGKRTPQPVAALKKVFPKMYNELVKTAEKLEKHYRNMQDMEFTIQHGKLYILQTRTGKRTATAAIKIAVDMVKEKLITKEEALMRVSPDDIEKALHPVIDPNEKYEVMSGKGCCSWKEREEGNSCERGNNT